MNLEQLQMGLRQLSDYRDRISPADVSPPTPEISLWNSADDIFTLFRPVKYIQRLS